jgi:glucokinase
LVRSTVNTILVADIGGTHARFGIAEARRGTRPKLSDRTDYDSQNFPSFADALRGYIQQIGLTARPPAAAIAAAGPVVSGRVNLTNRSWSISESELRAFGFVNITLINDFVALSYAIPTLEPRDVRTIGPELEASESASVSIVGAGTGFGVSCLVRQGAQALPLTTEGGHIGFAPSDVHQIQILQALSRQFGRVSVERILCGPGLENLHRIQQELAGRKAVLLSATELTRAPWPENWIPARQ